MAKILRDWRAELELNEAKAMASINKEMAKQKVAAEAARTKYGEDSSHHRHEADKLDLLRIRRHRIQNRASVRSRRRT